MAGLDPYTSRICMLQVGNVYEQYAIDVRCFKKDKIKRLLELVEDRKVIGQNLKFDLKMIIHHYDIRFTNVADTMLQEVVLECGRLQKGFGLKSLAEKYLNFKYANTNQLSLFSDNKNVGVISKDTRKTFKTLRDKRFSFTQVFYGLLDVELTSRVYLKQLERLANDDLFRASWIESHTLKVIAEMELNGLYLNQDKWLELHKENFFKFKEKEAQLLEYIKKLNIKDFINFQLDLFGKTDQEGQVDINLASSKQVIALCKILKIPTAVLDKELSKKHQKDVWKDSVEERHLLKYADQFKIIPIYLEYRKYLKAVSTYGKAFLENCNPLTGRIHSSYWQILDSSRISSSKPNLQNIPSKLHGFRECFTSSNNTRLVICDYSAQESRIAADISKDQNMIDFFNSEDDDFHSYTARKM